MSGFCVLADSTCDLGVDLLQKYNIEYLRMNYIVDDREYEATLDWADISSKEYYDLMRNGVRIQTTQVPRNVIEDVFNAKLDAGEAIVYIGCSSALSGSVKLAKLVADEILSGREGEIYVIDSLCSSLGQGMMAIWAAEMRESGRSAAETAQYIENNRLKVNQCGTVASLEYLRRAGRIKASKAFFGNLFGVKPLIISDIRGQNYAYKKVKGAVNARNETADMLIEAAENIADQTLYISHADNLEGAQQLRDVFMSKTKFKDVYISTIGPIVGASVGPGTIISFVYGKEVTIEGTD